MLVLRRIGLAVLLTTLPTACSGGSPAGSVQLTLGGEPRTLDAAELAALPVSTVQYHERSYTGVRLSDLPGAAGGPLRAVAADGYRQELAADVVARGDSLLAYAVDDGPLTADEGPLRLVVPGSKGLSVKRLVSLERP